MSKICADCKHWDYRVISDAKAYCPKVASYVGGGETCEQFCERVISHIGPVKQGWEKDKEDGR